MSAVFEAVGDVFEAVGDAVGDVIDVAVDVVEDVVDVVGDVVENALENPVATIATIAAVAAAPATGGASLQFIPAINAANTLAQGGDFEDALTSAAISYVAQGAGRFVGDVVGTAAQYGTDIGSQQTAMLAAQSGDMLGGTFGGTVGGAAGAAAAGATAAALSGGDIDQALVNALGNYAVRTGVNYGVNAAGRMVDQFGNEAPANVQNQILSNADDIRYELDNIGNVSPENILTGYTPPVTAPTVDPFEVDNVGNVSPESILAPAAPVAPTPAPAVEPYEVDNVGNVSPESILAPAPVVPEVPAVEPYEADNVGNVSPESILAPAPVVPEAPVIDPYEVDNVGNVSTENILTGLPEVPVVDPYEVDNVGNVSEENILTGLPEVPVVDPYEVDNVGSRSEGEILTGMGPEIDIAGAAGRYLKNQFTDALKQQIMGSLMPNRPGMPGGFRPPRSVSMAGIPGISSYLSELGFANLPQDGFTIQDEASPVSTSPIKLWDPDIDMNWNTQTKLGGLGFAGKFINQDQDQEYINQQEEERQRMMEEARQRGWMTDEERAMLEQEFDVLDPDQFAELSNMSPWLNLNYAEGGHIDHNPEFYSEGGASLANRYVKGDGDGTSDSVPAMLASGEFVIPADVVSGLGNGDNDAGAKVLDEFMREIRQHKRSTESSELPPDSEGPLSYLAKAKKKVGKNGRT